MEKIYSQRVKKPSINFFATGNEYMHDGLNLNLIPSAQENRGAVNLSDTNQSLEQSYLTAKYVFDNVERGTIKFVLIGLTPDSFLYDGTENSLRLRQLLNLSMTNAQANLNFNEIKNFFAKKDNVLSTLSKVIKKNVQILEAYIKLCFENSAQPVGLIFPFSPAARETYDKEILKTFREVIYQLEQSYNFICVDMFNLNLGQDCFYDLTHLNEKGILITNALLVMKLYTKKLIPIENFCEMSYDYFYTLSIIVPKDNYNALMEQVFNFSAKIIRRKDKIKVGFVLYDASMWCGDDLYNYFARDKRFEPTIFLCLRCDKFKDKLVRKDFLRGIQQFKSRGLNIVGLDDRNANIPAQDVFIFLTPYFEVLPNVFHHVNMTAKTLTTYIPYTFEISLFTVHNYPISHIAWKLFFPSITILDIYDKNCTVGTPRGLYSGYPRLDTFYKAKDNFVFNWKMARPNAKKIIYAPHWSINVGVNYATFQWNYQFMYEFAKAHPEISWVFKPHPNLLFSAINEKVFPSTEAFEEYLQKWNDLPNAQVYTGAYYQAIFATSDGMIHDCGSFTAEYQYVDKPMIYLTRKGAVFNELGHIILNVSYLVDGKDFASIASLMQKIFIEGNDYKAAMRKEIFDKYLNYQKANGMLASEFIYKNILQEL